MLERLLAYLLLLPTAFSVGTPCDECVPEEKVTVAAIATTKDESRQQDKGIPQMLIIPEEMPEEEKEKWIPSMLILPEEAEEATETTEPAEVEEVVEETTEATEAEEVVEETAEPTEAEEVVEETIEPTKVEEEETETDKYAKLHTGKLSARKGFITDGPAGPNGDDGYETWYDLDMTGVVQIMDELMKKKGEEDGCIYDYEYWVREDGCKMYGPYIMVAGDIINTRQRGDIIEISLGTAMVCDHCELSQKVRPYQIDVATDWGSTYYIRD